MLIACFATSLFSLSAFFSILKWWQRHDSHLYAYCLLYIFTICHKCLLFQFLGYGIGIQTLILTEIQKKRITGWKNGQYLLKNILFQLNFHDEGNLYANCLFHILSFFARCFFFSVFMLWHTYAHSHPKRSSKWTLSHQKTSHNLLNTCTFKLNFQDKVQWCANCFFHILSFSFKCFFFQFLIRGIRMHILIVTGLQMDAQASGKRVMFC